MKISYAYVIFGCTFNSGIRTQFSFGTGGLSIKGFWQRHNEICTGTYFYSYCLFTPTFYWNMLIRLTRQKQPETCIRWNEGSEDKGETKGIFFMK
ncbi:hypothetical protein QBC38DRAFT_466705 [Podospora fimiseda]|uniref:Uncharacterized protein n=1 Tax=Podospora fimiseda TaxID=252190 RepID=A0AAN7H3T0_9PEZI|nr:hypothetical protein QBC38DRAFT_466705 [Podospora fimiseda]